MDADVLIGALDADNAHHGMARVLFDGWTDRGETLSVSIVNLAEVLVKPAPDAAELAGVRQSIAALGVRPHVFNEAIAVDAARFRAVHGVSIADGFLLATAHRLHATVASFDRRVVRAAEAESLAVAQP